MWRVAFCLFCLFGTLAPSLSVSYQKVNVYLSISPHTSDPIISSSSFWMGMCLIVANTTLWLERKKTNEKQRSWEKCKLFGETRKQCKSQRHEDGKKRKFKKTAKLASIVTVSNAWFNKTRKETKLKHVQGRNWEAWTVIEILKKI